MVNNLGDDQTLIFAYLSKVKEGIVKESIAQDRVATGRTIASIQVRTGLSIGGTIEANASILATERGTSPAEYSKMDLLTLADALKEWASAKDLVFGNYYALAQHLRGSGSKLWRKGGRSGVLSKPIDEKELTDFTFKLSNIFLQQASSIIFK